MQLELGLNEVSHLFIFSFLTYQTDNTDGAPYSRLIRTHLCEATSLKE